MNLDFWVILTIGGLAAAYKLWHDALDARETANHVARETCSRSMVQFLDDTVAFSGFRLARNQHGLRRLLRTYTFDYSGDGSERAQGFIVLAGTRVEAVGLASRPS